MIEILLDLKDYDKQDTVFERVAARGIIKKENKYLVVQGKSGDCKFPGGGQEPGESLVETMVREVKEETGYMVKSESISKEPVYKVHEISKGEYEDIFIMDSYYYECDIIDGQWEQKLDEYEIEEGYQPKWYSLEEIKEKNSKALSNKQLRWVTRELLVTNKLIERISNR